MYHVSGEKKQDKDKVRNFTDLSAWQESHKVVLTIYNMSKTFPKEEQFGLTSQIRRAAVSVTSNIAEGFSRATTADKNHFYTIAQGSLTELQNQLLLARDLGYVPKEKFSDAAEQSVAAQKLINGLLKALKAGKGARQ